MRSWPWAQCLVGLSGILVACVPAGRYPLENLPSSSQQLPDLIDIQSRASIDYQPSRGSDLTVDLTLSYSGQGSPRVDLSHAEVRVDGWTWEPCRFGDSVQKEDLFVVLQSGAPYSQQLICRDVARPRQGIELRFFVSGAGGQGVVILSFGGFSTQEGAWLSPRASPEASARWARLGPPSLPASGAFGIRLG